MNHDALTYLLFTFGGCLGVYQIGAAAGGFKGLRFFRTATFTYIGGFGILGATYGWFFSCANLKMNAHNAAVVEGYGQLELFLMGAFLALITTFLISSLINLRGIKPDGPTVIGKGIDDLKSRTVFQAFSYRLKNRGNKR